MAKSVTWDFDLLIDEEEISKELGIDERGRVQKVIDSEFIKHMRFKMPWANGIMASSTREVEPGLVVVATPYAHYMNEGIKYINPKYKASGYPIYASNGVIVGFGGWKGKKIPSGEPLHYKGGPLRGAHFVERTIAQNRADIIKAAQRSIGK